jgi:hypothetical protein
MGAQQAMGGVARAVVPLVIGLAVDAEATTAALLATAATLLFLATRVPRVVLGRSTEGALHTTGSHPATQAS